MRTHNIRSTLNFCCFCDDHRWKRRTQCRGVGKIVRPRLRFYWNEIYIMFGACTIYSVWAGHMWISACVGVGSDTNMNGKILISDFFSFLEGAICFVLLMRANSRLDNNQIYLWSIRGREEVENLFHIQQLSTHTQISFISRSPTCMLSSMLCLSQSRILNNNKTAVQRSVESSHTHGLNLSFASLSLYAEISCCCLWSSKKNCAIFFAYFLFMFIEMIAHKRRSIMFFDGNFWNFANHRKARKLLILCFSWSA